MRTETAERVLEQARKILQEVKEGRLHTQDRIDWAKSIMNANLLWSDAKRDAHSLLNSAQAGEPVGIVDITKALRMTGDMGPRRSEWEAA